MMSKRRKSPPRLMDEANEALLALDKECENLDLPVLDTATKDSHFFDSQEEINRPSKFVLVNYDSVPKFLADNEFILSGYRVHFSFKLCLESLFRWHNETLNIWTHFIGILFFIGAMIYTFAVIFRAPGRTILFGDYVVFTLFFLGAHAQMVCSTTYHWFSPYSANAAKWLSRFDYMGICLMIVGSYSPPLYYLLRPCHRTIMLVHLSIIVFLGVSGVIITTLPKLQGPKYRTFRAVFFIIFGLYVLIPLPQMIWKLSFAVVFPMLWRLSIMGATYISGACIYASRYPERCCPGRFDYGWYSHPIWHVFVLAAGVTQYFNCLYALNHHGDPVCHAMQSITSS